MGRWSTTAFCPWGTLALDRTVDACEILHQLVIYAVIIPLFAVFHSYQYIPTGAGFRNHPQYVGYKNGSPSSKLVWTHIELFYSYLHHKSNRWRSFVFIFFIFLLNNLIKKIWKTWTMFFHVFSPSSCLSKISFQNNNFRGPSHGMTIPVTHPNWIQVWSDPYAPTSCWGSRPQPVNDLATILGEVFGAKSSARLVLNAGNFREWSTG